MQRVAIGHHADVYQHVGQAVEVDVFVGDPAPVPVQQVFAECSAQVFLDGERLLAFDHEVYLNLFQPFAVGFVFVIFAMLGLPVQTSRCREYGGCSRIPGGQLAHLLELRQLEHLARGGILPCRPAHLEVAFHFDVCHVEYARHFAVGLILGETADHLVLVLRLDWFLGVPALDNQDGSGILGLRIVQVACRHPFVVGVFVWSGT